jgi:hypothetical protein
MTEEDRIEICEKSGEGKIKQSRGKIHHGVDWARHVVVCGHIPEVTRMKGLQPQQVGGLAGGGVRTFLLPAHRRGVVMQGCYSYFGDFAVCRNNIWVHDRGGEFQVAVGEGARCALGSYQVR